MKIEINIGDIIYTGRFRNKKTTIKSISKDKNGQPIINGKQKILSFWMDKFRPESIDNIKENKKMKKSELRQLIREEIQRLNESGDEWMKQLYDLSLDDSGKPEHDVIMSNSKKIKPIIQKVFRQNLDWGKIKKKKKEMKDEYGRSRWMEKYYDEVQEDPKLIWGYSLKQFEKKYPGMWNLFCDRFDEVFYDKISSI